MARWLLYFVIWAVQAALVTLLVSAQWVEAQLEAERGAVQRYLGQDTAETILTHADGIYTQWFVRTNLVSATYRAVVPDRTKDQKGMEKLAPWLMRWMEGRLDAFWWIVYQSVFRLQVVVQWAPYCALLLFASLIDGMTKRQISKAEKGYANPVRYHSAWHLLSVLTILPLLYLSLPVHIHPMLVPIWGAALAMGVMMLSSNLQHRI